MIRHIRNMGRLVRAAWILSRYDALFAIDAGEAPAPVRAARSFAKLRARFGGGDVTDASTGTRLSKALAELGPSYIKLGQFLATRPDVIDPELARGLTQLQDRLPPFSMAEARATIEVETGKPVDALFEHFGEPVAAASIAQVHRARTRGTEGRPAREVAVKVLRPDVEERFARDLEAFFWMAHLVDRAVPSARRLKPVEVVQTLADSVELEMDLRLEAAAISEMCDRTKNDAGFRTPAVDWQRTAKRVLTLEWIDGIPIADKAALEAAGLDPKEIARNLIQTFLTHAVREGYFHADMHPGNIFVERDGTIVAIDYGIMGRLTPRESRFLAEILFGFTARDYKRVAQVHFAAGYVPDNKSVDAFAQALRSIGEPIMDLNARDISMGRLLAQLFEITDQFDMATRPELILLQKTMVVVEGVARDLDPDFNMWRTAAPVLKDWIEAKIGPEGRIQDALDGVERMGRLMGELPDLLDQAERAARLVGDSVTEGGLRLHPDTARQIAEAEAKMAWPTRAALWVGAGALAVIAALLAF